MNVHNQTIDKTPPDIGASLEWIHGYDGSNCRNNVRYSAGGEVGIHCYMCSDQQACASRGAEWLR